MVSFGEMQQKKQATLPNLLVSQLLAGSLGTHDYQKNKKNTYIYIYTCILLHICTSFLPSLFQQTKDILVARIQTLSFVGVYVFFFHTSPINELPIETASRVLTVTIQGFSPLKLKMSADIFIPSDAPYKNTMVKVSIRTRNPHLYLLTSLVQEEW